MVELVEQTCAACRAGAPLVSDEEIAEMHPQVPQWDLVKVDDIQQLRRRYTFSNFADALNFTNRLGGIAEAEGHHPTIVTEWGQVEVHWWSHKIRGLHKNDFIMAAKSDAAYTA